MSIETTTPIGRNLQQLAATQELFNFFNSGKHLNRVSEPSLWFELEQNENSYRDLFAALGYTLAMDGRGFAWFQVEEASSHINKTSSQFALIFMLIFDAQANTGKSLHRYHEWLVDHGLLEELYQNNTAILEAENIELTDLVNHLDRASTYGFTLKDGMGWRLLPAVSRYLDHFEALVREQRDADQDESVDDSEDL